MDGWLLVCMFLNSAGMCTSLKENGQNLQDRSQTEVLDKIKQNCVPTVKYNCSSTLRTGGWYITTSRYIY